MEMSKVLRVLGDYHQLIKIDGIWYEVKAKPVEDDVIEYKGLHYRKLKNPINFSKEVNDGVVMVGVGHRIPCIPVINPNRFNYNNSVGPRDLLINLNNERSTWVNHNIMNYGSVKIILRRQLNKKELIKHGLKNDTIRLKKKH